MASPFPGMDPYLEAPEIWRGFYHAVACEIIAQLHAVLGLDTMRTSKSALC